MSGPWERFKPPVEDAPAGPWERFKKSDSAPATSDQPVDAKNALAAGALKGATFNWFEEMQGAAAASPFYNKDSALNSLPVVGPINSTINSAIGGARLGLEALAPGTFGKEGGKQYDKRVTEARAYTKALEKAHPYATLAGNVAGGLAQAAAPIGLAAQGTSLLGKVGLGAAAGAATGGFAGLGDQDATTGALVGGVVGGALPVVSGAASAGTRKLLDMATLDKKLAQTTGMSPAAAKSVMTQMDTDGSLVNAGRNMRRLGDDAMPMDAGPSAGNLLDVAVSSDIGAAAKAGENTSRRFSSIYKQFNDLSDNLFGRPEATSAAVRRHVNDTVAERKALYDAAYNAPVNYTVPTGRALEEMQGMIPPSVLSKVNTMMRADVDLPLQVRRQALGVELPDGTFQIREMFNTQQWDYISRALNKMGKTDPTFGVLAKNIRQNLRDNVSAYGTAVDRSRELIVGKEAFKFGRNMLSQKVEPGDVAEFLTANPVSSARLEMAKGMRRNIENIVANARRAVSNFDGQDSDKLRLAYRNLNSDASKEKIRMVLGDEAATPYLQMIDKLEAALEAKARVAVGSKTAPRIAGREMVESLAAPGLLERLGSLRPVEALRRGAENLTGTGPELVNARKSQVWQDVASFMTGKTGDDALASMRALRKAFEKDQANAAKAQRAGNLGALLAGSGALGLGKYTFNQ